jgi:hypothetical protein
MPSKMASSYDEEESLHVAAEAIQFKHNHSAEAYTEASFCFY